MSEERYVIATIKPWNIELFHQHFSKKANFVLISDPSELTDENLKKIDPKFIFFPHWSWIIPKTIWAQFKCVVFHLTDLPYGRGGTPLQNLILAGKKTSKLSAISVCQELDGGDVYMKKEFSLSGSAEDVYRRVATMVFEGMIPTLIDKKIIPQPQSGEPTHFKRRTPEQSQVINIDTIEKLYDHIRMLDADEYPRAFLDVGAHRFEFQEARLWEEERYMEAKVRIYER